MSWSCMAVLSYLLFVESSSSQCCDSSSVEALKYSDPINVNLRKLLFRNLLLTPETGNFEINIVIMMMTMIMMQLVVAVVI